MCVITLDGAQNNSRYKNQPEDESAERCNCDLTPSIKTVSKEGSFASLSLRHSLCLIDLQ
jgi:hypothetical protein